MKRPTILADFPKPLHRLHLAMVGILLSLMLCIGGCDKQRDELAKVDSEKEANRILVALETHGIKQAQKVETTANRKTAWSITVQPADVAAARAVLVSCDLPREKHAGFSSIAESSSLIPSKGEERAKLLNALTGELEQTFETYDRVVSARVHIVLPERDVLMRDTTTKPTASAMVLIKYTPRPGAAAAPVSAKGSFPDVPVTADEVEQMVARSVEGLTPTNVYVTYTRAAEPEIAAVSGSAAPAAEGADSQSSPVTSLLSGSGGDRKLMMQLFAAVAILALFSILMTTLLVKEKRRKRVAAPAAGSTTVQKGGARAIG